MWGSKVWLLLLLGVCGCQSSARVNNVAPTPKKTAQTKRAAVAAPAPKVEKKESFTLDDYRAGFMKQFMRVTRARRVAEIEPPKDVVPQHSVHVVKKVGRERFFITFTNGLGFGSRPDEAKRLELIAYSEEQGPGIVEILARLGSMMHQDTQGKLFQAYQSVAFPEPILELQYFDLRPGGEVEVTPGILISLLRVVPLTKDEYERGQEGNSSQWVDSDAADPDDRKKNRLRWRPVTDVK